MPVLHSKLRAALESRKDRAILRQVSDTSSEIDRLVDFSSNSYLSLDVDHRLRDRFIASIQSAPNVLGSGGSRLLDGGTSAHAALERRLAVFFQSPAALLFNSGFEANVSLFSCLPQLGDAVVFDAFIHASVHDGMRASRASKSLHPFRHNCTRSLALVLENLVANNEAIREGRSSVFIAVESLYSMDGDFAPLVEICDVIERTLWRGNGYLICDEAHTTGIYGENGRGVVSALGIQHRVFIRLHTWGKALASQGAVIICPPLVREYLINYARPLIYTTAMSHSAVIAMSCSIDMLENGTASKLSSKLQELSQYFTSNLRKELQRQSILTVFLLPSPPDTQSTSSLRTPIIPILTSRPRSLAAFLRTRGLLVRPISYPTVPKGKDRVRVCIHALNTREEVNRLIKGLLDWASSQEGRIMLEAISTTDRAAVKEIAKL